MSFYSDDPVQDFNRWDMELERKRARRPQCEMCEEHIQDETAILLHGHWICEKCINNNREIVDEFDFD